MSKVAVRLQKMFPVGLQATRTMSIRDVIYVTRAVLPHLKNLGITGLTIGSLAQKSWTLILGSNGCLAE